MSNVRSKAKKKVKQYVYEVGIPVSEIWVMEVVASNRKEAKEKARGPDAHQVCSLAGTRGYVRRRRELK